MWVCARERARARARIRYSYVSYKTLRTRVRTYKVLTSWLSYLTVTLTFIWCNLFIMKETLMTERFSVFTICQRSLWRADERMEVIGHSHAIEKNVHNCGKECIPQSRQVKTTGFKTL